MEAATLGAASMTLRSRAGVDSAGLATPVPFPSVKYNWCVFLAGRDITTADSQGDLDCLRVFPPSASSGVQDGVAE